MLIVHKVKKNKASVREKPVVMGLVGLCHLHEDFDCRSLIGVEFWPIPLGVVCWNCMSYGPVVLLVTDLLYATCFAQADAPCHLSCCYMAVTPLSKSGLMHKDTL